MENDETETNNQKTLDYLCKILAGVFESDKEEEFNVHHQEHSYSVCQAQDTQDSHLTQEYDVEPDPDGKGDRLNFNFFNF